MREKSLQKKRLYLVTMVAEEAAITSTELSEGTRRLCHRSQGQTLKIDGELIRVLWF